MSSGAEVWARLAVLPLFVLIPPWRCDLMAPPRDGGGGPAFGDTAGAASAVNAKQEAPAGRVSSVPPRTPPVKLVTLPEEVVVKAMAVGQTAFLSCWARAQRTDPVLISTKVQLHLEIDEGGKVTAIRSDTESPTLSSCLARVVRRLPFPAPGKPAVVDMPLIFQ
jgi:hypothetical protein